MSHTKPTRQSKLTTVLTVLYRLIFAALIIIILLLLASRLPIPGNYRLLLVRSGSMKPAIPTGSVVIVKPGNNYRVDDVVTYQLSFDELPVTHRIKEIKTDGSRTTFITQGDANNAPDLAAVPESRVLGRVLFHVPYVGYGVAAVRQPLGFLLMIIIPALFIVAEEAVDIVKEIKKRKITKAKVIDLKK